MFQTLRRAGVLTAAILAIHASASAQLRTGHAIPGFYGMESSVPPPLGLSFENTFVFYNSSDQKDRDGNSAQVDGTINHASNHSTLTWMSPWLLIGGNWVMRVRVPLTNSETNPHSVWVSGSGFGLGDVMVEPLVLYWEGGSHFIHIGYEFWVNSGSFTFSENDNYGKGFTTHQATAGVTFFPDEEREWHVSVLGRYELHDEMDGADLTPGQNFTFDWSVGKHLNERWNIGLIGYGVWQVTQEKGDDGNGDQGYYGTAAAGAEIRYAMPDWGQGGNIMFRALREYNAFNRPEGTTASFGIAFEF